jgi:hypothetical protein
LIRETGGDIKASIVHFICKFLKRQNGPTNQLTKQAKAKEKLQPSIKACTIKNVRKKED